MDPVPERTLLTAGAVRQRQGGLPWGVLISPPLLGFKQRLILIGSFVCDCKSRYSVTQDGFLLNDVKYFFKNLFLIGG